MGIDIYCDGACRGNQQKNNIGAWGYVLAFGAHKKEVSGVESNTTNNRMELLACVKALEQIKNKSIPVVVYSDSQYLVSTINLNWARRANTELWEELDKLTAEFTSIKFVKVKGHSDNEGNARADELCNLAMDNYIAENPVAVAEPEPEPSNPLKATFFELIDFANFMLGIIDKYQGKKSEDISDEDYENIVQWQAKDQVYDNAVVNVIKNL